VCSLASLDSLASVPPVTGRAALDSCMGGW
jgi:hypothetical protein